MKEPKRPGHYACPSCGARGALTIDSRPGRVGEHSIVRRRRACRFCKHRWTTYEMTDEVISEMFAARRELDQLRRAIRNAMLDASDIGVTFRLPRRRDDAVDDHARASDR